MDTNHRADKTAVQFSQYQFYTQFCCACILPKCAIFCQKWRISGGKIIISIQELSPISLNDTFTSKGGFIFGRSNLTPWGLYIWEGVRGWLNGIGGQGVLVALGWVEKVQLI